MRTLLAASLLLLSACTSAAPAPDAQESEPQAEQLTVKIPEGWSKYADRRVGDLHTAEYYPTPDPTDNWERKITIEALSGDDLPDPLIVAQGLATEQKDVCNEFEDNPVFAGFENGYPTVVHMMKCGASQRTGRQLLTMIKVIQANDALYTITRIWRYPPSASPDAASPIDEAEVAAWASTLRDVTVCDDTLAAHRCKS